MSITARDWDDARTFALSRQHAAERYEAKVEVPSQWPDHAPSRDRLLRGLRLAAQVTAEVWAEAAEEARTFFLDAAAHEQRDEDAQETRPRPAPGVYTPEQGAVGTVRNALGEVVTPARLAAFHVCTARNCRTCAP